MPAFPQKCLAALLAAALLLTPTLASAQVAKPIPLPALGDGVDDIDLQDERRYGDWIMSHLRGDPAVLDDPLLQGYIESLWQPLLQAARQGGHLSEEMWQHYAWQTLLVRERQINASAWPGGYFAFNLGLIAMTGQRDELASVMGHELSHVTQRHIARGASNSAKAGVIQILGMLAAVLAASAARSSDVAYGVMSATQTAAQQQQLRFSRDMEREADRVGHSILADAGFQQAGMVRMFERMDLSTRLMDNGAFPYLRSHPLTSERIGEARQRVSLAGADVAPRGLALHSLMAARARVLMDERVESLQSAAALDQGARDAGLLPQLAARYTAALAAYKQQQRARGDAAVAAARGYLADVPADERATVSRLLTLLEAEGAGLCGDAASGLRLLAALDDGPGDRPLLLLQADLAAKQGAAAADRRAVLDRLQTHLTLHPQDGPAWRRSALLWNQQSQPLRAVRAEAEAHAARGDLRGAIDRLRAGLRQARPQGSDPIETAVLDARLRTLLRERRALLEELYPRGIPREEL